MILYSGLTKKVWYLKNIIGRKELVTMRALLLALFLVNSNVLIEVSFLGETLLTTRNRTEGSGF